MNQVFRWIKMHRLAALLICIFVFAFPLLIVHILFRAYSSIPWFEAKWSAGDVLAYIAGFEALLGTVILGLITVTQSEKANEVNERLARENNHLQKISIQPLLPLLKVKSLEIENAAFERQTSPSNKSCVYISASVTQKKYQPHIKVFIMQSSSPSHQYRKIVNLTLENISSTPISQIAVDYVGFCGFNYKNQHVNKTVCKGISGHNTISWMILPSESIDVCVDILYDDERFTNFWEFRNSDMIGSFDVSLFLTNKSISGVEYREKIFLDKAADLKVHIMYKAYEENHSGEDITP